MITIDREGARRIAQQFHVTSDPSALLAAFESAAAGDFAPLAELVGTREVEGATCPSCDGSGSIPSAIGKAPHRCVPCCGTGIVTRPPNAAVAPAPAPDFRVDDEFQMYPASDNGHGVLRVEWPARNSHGALDCIRVRDGAKMSVHPHAVNPATLRRRHFRAGERCGTVAVGQFLRTRNGVNIRITERNGDAGWFGVWRDCGIAIRTYVRADEASQLPLGEDYSAPEAVPCEVKP